METSFTLGEIVAGVTIIAAATGAVVGIVKGWTWVCSRFAPREDYEATKKLVAELEKRVDELERLRGTMTPDVLAQMMKVFKKWSDWMDEHDIKK